MAVIPDDAESAAQAECISLLIEGTAKVLHGSHPMRPKCQVPKSSRLSLDVRRCLKGLEQFGVEPPLNTGGNNVISEAFC